MKLEILGLLRESFRALSKQPATTSTVVATLALALGATTAVYTAVHSVLLAPLPYEQPERLVRVWESRSDWLASDNENLRSKANRLDPHYPRVRQWQEAATGFSAFGSSLGAKVVAELEGEVQVLPAQEADADFFGVLDVKPLLGRALEPTDDRPGAAPVVVLGEELWRSRFGSEEVLGRSLELDGVDHVVIGVLAATFAPPVWPIDADLPQLWIPLSDDAREGDENVTVVARLEESTSLEAAARQLGVVQAQLNEQLPAHRAPRDVRPVLLLDAVAGHMKATLGFLLAAALLVLLVAAVNVSHVLAVRGVGRLKDFALRRALGASNGRLVAGLLAETSMLSLLGGGLGLLAAQLGLPLLRNSLATTLPRAGDLGVTAESALLCLLLSLLCAFVIVTYPALLAIRGPQRDTLRIGSVTETRAARNARSFMVIGEVALAFVLLVGASLLALSYSRLWSVERGFVTQGIVSMTIVPDPHVYDTGEREDAFLQALWTRLNALDGVTATVANNLPLSGEQSGSPAFYTPSGGTEEQRVTALLSVGFENYLDALGIPVLAGRPFDGRDGGDSRPVALVNQVMAERLTEGQPLSGALAKTLRINGNDEITVVGVVANVRHRGLANEIQPKIYLPAAQSRRSVHEWVLRVDGDLGVAVQRAKEELQRLAPTTPVSSVSVLDQTITRAVAVPRLRSRLVSALAGLAVFLALIGIYGSLAFSVSQRVREIGVRRALGANRGRVVQQILGHGLRLTCVGLGVGFVASLLVSRVLSEFLFEIPSLDPSTYLLAAAATVGGGVLAGLIPALRAAAIEPQVAMRIDT
ncbi:MAG: ADOP family duplicated permease [Acidobacteriota bacterium]